ncbi:MAG TPA: cytochrome c-type biogenesis protein [Chloroflexota bacterium]|nr:cytochrome c-type biogenesis protein [Chloroflexota bacterium]
MPPAPWSAACPLERWWHGWPVALAGWLALVALAVLPTAAWAQDSAAVQREATEIARTLKCPVCENQSVAESPSPLAREMRAYIQRRLAAGDSREAIVQDLVERYGEGILLEPPRAGFTLLVWWLPLLSLGLGAGVVALALWRWKQAPTHLVAPAEPLDEREVAPEDLARYRAWLAAELERRERGPV